VARPAKGVVGHYRRAVETEVYSNDRARVLAWHIWQRDDGVQPEFAFAQNQVRAVEADSLAEHALRVRIGSECDELSPSYAGKTGFLSQHAVGPCVVANRHPRLPSGTTPAVHAS